MNYPEIWAILNVDKKQVKSLVTIALGNVVLSLGEVISPDNSMYKEFLYKLKVYQKQSKNKG